MNRKPTAKRTNQRTTTSTDTRRPKIKRPPVLFEKAQAVFRAISKSLDGTFLSYWTSEQGSICASDVQAMYEVLRIVKPQRNITLFVKSSGGDGQSALRLIHLLRERCDFLRVLVPLECASAATMLALGADEIHMGPLAFLTPVDTALDHPLGPLDHHNESAFVGQDELHRVLALWEKHAGSSNVNPFHELFKYLHPLAIGAVDRATSLSIRLCSEILQYHMKDVQEAERIARALNADYPAHEYPITPRQASALGLSIRELDPDVHEHLLALNSLYSEMGQRAVTDYDERNYHDNEIVNIVEGPGVQLYFQNDKDWHYRHEERQWSSLRVESSWYRSTLAAGRVKRARVYIS